LSDSIIISIYILIENHLNPNYEAINELLFIDLAVKYLILFFSSTVRHNLVQFLFSICCKLTNSNAMPTKAIMHSKDEKKI
jgi:hypothetical protein